MRIQLPDNTVKEILDCKTILMKGSMGSVEYRCRNVERIQNHVGEIVTAMVLKAHDEMLKNQHY